MLRINKRTLNARKIFVESVYTSWDVCSVFHDPFLSQTAGKLRHKPHLLIVYIQLRQRILQADLSANPGFQSQKIERK